MFDFAWSEIALIGVVALVLIGPKDMPVAIRAISNVIKKARRMAGEFQTHVDEMVREANLDEVRSQIQEIRNFDIRGEVEKAVDADGSIRGSFASQPFDPWKDGFDLAASTTAVASAVTEAVGRRLRREDRRPAPRRRPPSCRPRSPLPMRRLRPRLSRRHRRRYRLSFRLG